MVEDVLIKARAIELIRAQDEKRKGRKALVIVGGCCFAFGVVAGVLLPINIALVPAAHSVVNTAPHPASVYDNPRQPGRYHVP